MGNCKDCKHWTHPVWHKVHDKPNHGICELADVNETDETTFPHTKARTLAHDGGSLETSADFGCVQFEPIPEKVA